MRLLTTSVWAAIAVAALTAVVPGREPQPEVTPLTPPSDAALPESTPPEDAQETPRNSDSGISDVDAFGMGGRGMGGLGMGSMGMGGPGYGVTWYPSRPASGAGPQGDFGLIRQDVSAGVPVWRDGGDMVMFSAGVRDSQFSTDATLPESHRPFPDELWNVRLGANYLHRSNDGWSYGGGVFFGSASDKPFHSINEMNLGFMSFVQMPARREGDFWRFSLMYSPVGNFNFPIPGVAYLWNPSKTLHVSIGLPPAVLWRPTEDLTLTLFYMPITTGSARATYRLVDRVFLYIGFESLQEAYFLADREDEDDRFLGYEKRLVGGIRWDVWRHAALEMSAGYAFDRYYGVGQNQFEDLRDQVDIAPGPFVSANARIRF